MTQWMLAIWSLVPLPFLHPAGTSESLDSYKYVAFIFLRESIPRQVDKKSRVTKEEKGVWGFQGGHGVWNSQGGGKDKLEWSSLVPGCEAKFSSLSPFRSKIVFQMKSYILSQYIKHQIVWNLFYRCQSQFMTIHLFSTQVSSYFFCTFLEINYETFPTILNPCLFTAATNIWRLLSYQYWAVRQSQCKRESPLKPCVLCLHFSSSICLLVEWGQEI